MVELGIVAGLPVALEIITCALAQVLVAGDVANGRVQPNVEVFVGVTRNLETKIGRIAGDIPILKSRVNPLSKLIGYRRLQLLT